MLDALVEGDLRLLGCGGDGLDVRTVVLEEGWRRRRKASVSSERQHRCMKNSTNVRTTANAQVAAAVRVRNDGESTGKNTGQLDL